uniref:Uncharacterized protein n=1 Tax=Knipowitschia caucasica TaxID=637954 RepID=A0AAV2L9T3_KNICA
MKATRERSEANDVGWRSNVKEQSVKNDLQVPGLPSYFSMEGARGSDLGSSAGAAGSGAGPRAASDEVTVHFKNSAEIGSGMRLRQPSLQQQRLRAPF